MHFRFCSYGILIEQQDDCIVYKYFKPNIYIKISIMLESKNITSPVRRGPPFFEKYLFI